MKNQFIIYDPSNPHIFQINGSKLGTKYNKNHVVKWAWKKSSRFKGFMADGWYNEPDIFQILHWKWFNGPKPKIKRTYEFISPCVLIWFSNSDEPVRFNCWSNKDALEFYNEFWFYMLEKD